MRYIYVLRDPDNNEIKYVGQTNDINRRFRDHLRRSLIQNDSEYNTYKSRWIRKILSSNKEPFMEIIEECKNFSESNEKEKYWIEYLLKTGHSLTNSHVNDVTEFSIETKEKMSSAKKGKKLEDIVGEEKAKELKIFYSERIKTNNPNKSNNNLVRNKISNTLKEFFSDKENHWAYGKKMSDEHNEKLRQAKLNNPKNVGNRKPRTEEQKEKMRKSILGKTIKRYHILQYDLEGNFVREWSSLREIEKMEPLFKRNQISKCCKEKRQNYAGFIWKYKTEN